MGTSSFKMDLSVNLTLKLRRTKARLQQPEFLWMKWVHRTQEMEFSSFSCLSVKPGNMGMYAPSKGQGNIPTAALRCEQAKLSSEKHINNCYLHLNEKKGSLRRRME